MARKSGGDWNPNTNKNLYWDLEASLANCPQLALTLFGEEIELAILRFQKWGPDESVGIFTGDLEVTSMAWRASFMFYDDEEIRNEVTAEIDSHIPWNLVHSYAVSEIQSAYYSELMDAIEKWEKERMIE